MVLSLPQAFGPTLNQAYFNSTFLPVLIDS